MAIVNNVINRGWDEVPCDLFDPIQGGLNVAGMSSSQCQLSHTVLYLNASVDERG